LGSLAGILLYTLLCFLYQPPSVWFALAGAMLVALVWRAPAVRLVAAASFVIFAALACIGPAKGRVYWSPYQKLSILPHEEGGETVGYILNTNDTWYQQVVDLSAKFAASHPVLFESEPIEWNPYNVPYHFYPQPESVLVLGSGMGNDVAAALRNGAGRVTAVEIDPMILELGREKHFEHPYQSPRVEVVNNDARSYIENSHQQFDLIVFSLLDSHTTTSNFTNTRIHNYVYTLEAPRQARRLLRPDGLLILKFRTENPWIAGRLHQLMQETFGQPPLQFRSAPAPYDTYGSFFVS